MRFGARVHFLQYFRVSANFNFQPEEYPFYDDLSTGSIAFSPYGNEKKNFKKLNLSVGKLKPKFTREYSIVV